MSENKLQFKPKKRKFKTVLGTITILGGIALGSYYINKDITDNNFTRIVNEDGEYELEGFISYDNLTNCKVIEIKTIINETKMYIASNEIWLKKIPNNIKYYDIYSGKLIGIDSEDSSKNTVISSNDIEDFLIAYDMIKDRYYKEDIDYLINRIKDDYQNSQSLKLLKTKDE